jgi:hypothetical protein
MDATVAQILLGVLSNLFTSTLERSVSDISEVEVDAALEAAGRELFARTNVGDQLDRDAFIEFLRGPEVTTTLRMLFIASANAEPKSTAEIEADFQGAFTARFGDRRAGDGKKLFAAFSRTMERILQAAAGEGSTDAESALDSFRFRYLKEELAGLKASLEDLKRPPSPTAEEIAAWEALYRSQVQSRHGTIVPPSLDTSDRVPIDEIYLPPTFRSEGTDADGAGLSSIDLASSLSRAVILGDPGAGKSTFAQKLAHDLASERARVPGGSLIPFLIDLKEYGAEKERSRVSITDWLESLASSDYNAPAPPGVIAYLLSSGRAAVIFDGLDELLDTSQRKRITADVETFASRYVAAPILVTSRRVGYPQAPLDPRRFVVYQLNELGEDQIESYAHVWFGRRQELTAKESTEMTTGFLEDSGKSAADLRRNMLMLGLLCNLYRGEGHIPRHRPQVYEKCAVMLFERWDKGRKIVVELEFERHLRPAMQHLAYWIYSEPSLRGGVTEPDLVKRATGYLLERRFEDQDEARAEACRFVEFCRGRAWVFTDTGTTPEGDRLYQFTHRTFLEFFAAEHLVRTRSTPDELLSILRPRIAAGEWDVVAQLAFQLQDDNIDGAADVLLGSLVDSEDDRPEELELMYNFAARALAFLVPRRDTCRMISRVVTRQTAEWLTGDRHRWADDRVTGPLESHLYLIQADRENFQPVAQELLGEVYRYVDEDRGDLKRAAAGVEIAMNADMAVRQTSAPLEPAIDFTAAASEKLWPLLRDHVAGSRKIAIEGFRFGKVPIEIPLDRFSADILFDYRDLELYPTYFRHSIIEDLFEGQFADLRRPDGTAIGTLAELMPVGLALEGASTPWDTRQMRYRGLLSRTSRLELRERLRGSALFGAFGTLAWISEHMFYAEETERLIGVLTASSGQAKDFLPYIRHRFDRDEGDFPVLDCGERTRLLIDTWTIGGWSATTPPGPDDGPAMRAELIDD